jgi:hypothetical protein
MERLRRIYWVVLPVVIAVVLLLPVLELLARFVAWFWPCEWPWQPFGAFNPYCPRTALARIRAWNAC